MLLIDPYCYSIWGRLMSYRDKFRLYYLVTMDIETADIMIYSCWPSKEKKDYYHVYKWRGELPNKHGDIRRYRRLERNLKGYYYIPPCWPTPYSIQRVVRGERQMEYIKRPDLEQSEQR